ncbi:MAG: energy-coupling factor transporter transmembrane component T [Calothrix sp. MO_192.B10]|nr:energy-coupling factor transporter transmembrane component T [Calothrix sp. MO_192.B10]
MRISKHNHQKHSFLSQINPLLKIVICIFLISFAFLLQKILSLGLLVGLLLILLFSQVNLKFTRILKVTILLGLFLILSTWLLGDFNKSLFSALRLLAITLPTPLLASTTAPSDLIRALQASRLPGFLVLSLMLIWRFLPIIQQETQRIIEANQLRGVNLSRQPRQWFTGLFIPLIFQIVAYADDVTIGLQTRGYDPAVPRSNSQPLIWKMQDLVFAIAVFLIMMGVSYLEWT